MGQQITVDVVSDVVCPWCYVGKRQLEQALAQFAQSSPQIDVKIRWLPFQLNPDLPAEGIDRADYLARKFGTSQASAIYERVKKAGTQVGLTLNMEAVKRQPNTLAAHALIAQLQETDSSKDAPEAFFKAYFVEGMDLTNEETLAQIAAQAGMDQVRATEVLQDQRLRAQTAEQDLAMREMGVSGVPFFIFNGKFAVSGAQGAPALVQALGQASQAHA